MTLTKGELEYKMSQKKQIIDLGMHDGVDTEFYLKKGFRVVAVEANPELVGLAENRFEAAIQNRDLTIIPKAISHKEGIVSFFINQENSAWSTLSDEYAQRNARIGTQNKCIEVSAICFESILEEFGIPYYLKIDIEGVDNLCLYALQKFEQKPAYISIETSGTNDFSYTFESLAILYTLGYRDFKLVNQFENRNVILPNPSLEGTYVEHRFQRHSSGPFGEETLGNWQPIEPIIKKYQKILRHQARWTIQSKYYNPYIASLHQAIRRLFSLEVISWFDIHAKFPQR